MNVRLKLWAGMVTASLVAGCATAPDTSRYSQIALPDNAAGEPCSGAVTSGGLEIYCGRWREPSGVASLLSDMASKDDLVQTYCAADAVSDWEDRSDTIALMSCPVRPRVLMLVQNNGASAFGYSYPGDLAALEEGLSYVLDTDLPEIAGPENAGSRSDYTNLNLLRREARRATAEQRFVAAEQILVDGLASLPPGDKQMRAELLAELAIIFSSQERFYEANENLSTSEDLAADLNTLSQGRIALARAIVFLDQGQPSAALAQAERAETLILSDEIASDSSTPASSTPDNAGRPAPSTNIISTEDARYIEYVRRADAATSDLLVRSESSQMRMERRVILTHIRYIEANAYLALGNDAAASEIFRELTASVPIGSLEAQLFSLLAAEDLARIDAAAGRTLLAARNLTDSLAALDPRLRDTQLEVRLKVLAATYFARAGVWQESVQLALESATAARRLEEDQGLPTESVDELLSRLIERYNDEQQPEQVGQALFQLFAAEEGQVARQASAQLRTRLSGGQAAGSIQTFQNAKRRLRQAEARLVRSRTLEIADETIDSELVEAVAVAREELDRSEQALRASAPGYFSLLVEKADLEKLRSVLLQTNHGYAKLVQGRDALYIMMMSPEGRAEFMSLEIARRDMEDVTRRYLAGFEPPASFAQDLPDFDFQAACWLSEQVVQPMLTVASSYDTEKLVIEPSTGLSTMPFSSLYIEADVCNGASPADSRLAGEAEYIVDRYAVSITPSIDMFVTAASMSSTDEQDASDQDDITYLGFGGPTGPRAIAPQVDRLIASRRLPAGLCRSSMQRLALKATRELPDARREVQIAASRLGSQSQSVTGADFTKSRVTESDFTDVDILSIATHTYFYDYDQGYDCFVEPGLIVAPSEETDLLLGASDIANLRMDVDLAILSACETAIGAGQSDGAIASGGLGESGEALGGLAQAFVFAGVKSILATHWLLQDEAGLAFNEGFIERIKSGDTVAQAYRATQQDMRQSDRFGDPIYWAAFSMYGYADYTFVAASR